MADQGPPEMLLVSEESSNDPTEPSSSSLENSTAVSTLPPVSLTSTNIPEINTTPSESQESQSDTQIATEVVDSSSTAQTLSQSTTKATQSDAIGDSSGTSAPVALEEHLESQLSSIQMPEPEMDTQPDTQLVPASTTNEQLQVEQSVAESEPSTAVEVVQETGTPEQSSISTSTADSQQVWFLWFTFNYKNRHQRDL